MEKIFKFVTVLFLSMCAVSTVYASTQSITAVKANSSFTSQVSLVNQSSYTYTVTASYMSQSGVSRSYTMTLYPYPMSGSMIQFGLVLPEYAVYLQVVRNIDGYPTYAGYVSSDDVYIRDSLANSKAIVDVVHH